MFPYKLHGTDAFGTPLRRAPLRAGRESLKRKRSAPPCPQSHSPQSGLEEFLTCHGISTVPSPCMRYREGVVYLLH
ncbi:UNVERIFIED_CONTAM: hypothetical protein K2H54_042309 [Gekko kuhli]